MILDPDTSITPQIADKLESGNMLSPGWRDRAERTAISDYYDESEIDYRVWSVEGYRHFGYWHLGIWPWQRRRMLEAMNDVVFEQLDIANFKSGNVGDLGCGTAAVARYGCDNLPQLGWHAITISREQADQGREKFEEARRLHAEDRTGMDSVHHGDYHVLPWPDDFLDAAFFFESLCHSTEPEVALREAVRVLKPGGRLVIADGFVNHPFDSTSRWFRRLHDEVAHNWAVPRFHEIALMPSWLEASGLKLLKRREMGWRMAVSASHSVPLVLTHTAKMLIRGKSTAWQWKHLRASALAMLLGMQRKNFGYYLLTLQKPLG
jgi:ubiquinone/menaquinone biosynthesis C-methylase UbiE